jgi:hypothetical protein
MRGRFESAMGQVLQFLRHDRAFDCQTTTLLAAAYEKAVAGIEGRDNARILREIAARRIIASASRGERDPDRLCDAALATLARTGEGTPNVAAARHTAGSPPDVMAKRI